MHSASGLFILHVAWGLLAFASLQFAPKIVDLSACFIRILFYSSLRAQRLVHAYTAAVLLLLLCGWYSTEAAA